MANIERCIDIFTIKNFNNKWLTYASLERKWFLSCFNCNLYIFYNKEKNSLELSSESNRILMWCPFVLIMLLKVNIWQIKPWGKVDSCFISKNMPIV